MKEIENTMLLEDRSIEDQLNLKERALSSSSEGITIADATKSNFPLIYVNKGFEKLTGFSAEEACGTNCRFLQGKDTDLNTIDKIRTAINEKRECIVEILNYRKNGNPFWNRLSITPIIGNAGEVTHFVGVQSDVTARREAEDALRVANTKLIHAKDLIQKDLQLAAEIQKSFLPPNELLFDDLKVEWELLPCDELAGDTLNVIEIDDHNKLFYVIDVSGHGVQAALLSVTLNRWLTLNSKKMDNPVKGNLLLSPTLVLEQLNRQFPFDPQTGQYFTIFYGVYNSKSNELSFVSAGHPPPIYIPKNGSPSFIKSNNFPIGIVPDPDFKESTINISTGDQFYIYSDGIIDATDKIGNHFGEESLLSEITNIKNITPTSAINNIINLLKDYTKSNTFKDDISLLGVEFK